VTLAGLTKCLLLGACAAIVLTLASVQASSPPVQNPATPWIATWAATPQTVMPGTLETYENQTLRLIVHTSVGGKRARIHLSNTFGSVALTIGMAHLAHRTSGADVDPASDRVLTFAGQHSVSVPPGATLVSDPVELEVPASSDLAVSLYLPTRTEATTSHFLALQTSYLSGNEGDVTAAAMFPVARTTGHWPFVTGVDVAASPGSYGIVALGDSLIDGVGSSKESNARWPDLLAARIQSAAHQEVGVINEGLIGNRLLRDSPVEVKQFGAALGESGIKRFQRDVVDQAGARYVIVRLGGNDLSFPGEYAPKTQIVNAADLIAGYRTLIERAHERGMRLIAITITPYSFAPDKEKARQEFNDWMRSSKELDGVIDFDKVLRDPQHPTQLLAAYDSGDQLHPNDAGYAAAVNSLPLSLLGVH
jgi:lysophospholipase L1-like esterase